MTEQLVYGGVAIRLELQTALCHRRHRQIYTFVPGIGSPFCCWPDGSLGGVVDPLAGSKISDYLHLHRIGNFSGIGLDKMS